MDAQAMKIEPKVFGTPITTQTLEGMPKYAGQTTTRLDRAHLALNTQNADGKEDDARKYLNNLKDIYGNGASTKCLFYNATGDRLTFVLSHDYYGSIYEKSPYPVSIENGQWGAFLHVHATGAATGSSAAVVYHGLNNTDESRDWCLAWITPWSDILYNNYAFADVRKADYYFEDHWKEIDNSMNSSGQANIGTWGECVSKASIERGTTVFFKGIMTLEGA